jgi:AraC-like DNA-binding protein
MPKMIQSSLDYIEQDLKTDITAEELARMANYSTFHYYRLFSSVMESSVSSYIQKRRLDNESKLTKEEKQAIFHVICSIQMICVAYFESHEEFKQLAKTNRNMLMYIVNRRA